MNENVPEIRHRATQMSIAGCAVNPCVLDVSFTWKSFIIVLLSSYVKV